MSLADSSIPERPRLAFALACALSLANLFAHKPISDLCDALFERIGQASYEAVALVGIGLMCAVPAGLVLQRGGQAFGARRFVSLAGLFALTLAAQRWLLVSNIELVHFPQFALLAALLLRGGVAPLPAWWIATLAGGFDELYQHMAIYRGVAGTYLDFNDMLLNGIGAAWGVLLWPATLQRSGPGQRALKPVGLSALLLLWVVLLSIDPPRLVPLLDRALTGRAYRVLTPAEAIAGLALVWTLVSRGFTRGGNGGAGPEVVLRRRRPDWPKGLLRRARS